MGGNAAGLTAASRARRIDSRLDIVVVEKTGAVAYSTCGTPYFIAGDVESQDLISMTSADFARDRNIGPVYPGINKVTDRCPFWSGNPRSGRRTCSTGN